MASPADEVEISFNDMTITQSSTSVIACVRLPDDALPGLYFPRDVNLYLDGSKVDAVLVTNGAPLEIYDNHPAVEIDARYVYTGESDRVYCGEFTWHIALDIMPDTIRIEIPSLYTSQIPHRFESQEQRLYYARLLAEQGYELAVIEGEEGFMTSQFPDAWHDLDPVAQAIIQNEVLDAFFTEFPPDEPYIASWEHTFNLREQETVIWNPPYNAVTVADIEAMATPLNLRQTRDDISIQLDWAYADANQVVLAYTPYDAEGNPIHDYDATRTNIEMHHYLENSNGSSLLVPQVFARDDASAQQIARFIVPGAYINSTKQTFDGEVELRTLASWNFRTEFRSQDSDLWGPDYVFNFEVPFSPLQFEQHIEVDISQETANPVTDFEFNFNDLIITDTATTIFMCMISPDDLFPAFYFAPDVQLSVDGYLVETLPLTNYADAVINNHVMPFSASYHSTVEVPHTTCAQFVWHMVFEELPSTIRIEIPELRPVTRKYFVDEAQVQTYLNLFAEEGYNLTYTMSDEPQTHYAIDDSVLYDALDKAERDDLMERVWEAFGEIYPHDERYAVAQDYSFYIDEPEIVISNPPYNPVTVADIEAMATPLNLRQIQDNIAIQLDWAYADANQIVVAMQLFDEDGNVLRHEDYPVGALRLWRVEPDLASDEPLEASRTWEFGRKPLLSDTTQTQQILSFPVRAPYLMREDTNLSDTIHLEANFLIETVPDEYTEYSVDFEIPFALPHYEQQNNFININEGENPKSSANDSSIYFNSLIVTDSATSLDVCTFSPEQHFDNVYYPGTVNLYIDREILDESILPYVVGSDAYVGEYMVIEDYNSYYYAGFGNAMNTICEQYVWDIAFDLMPDSIHVEIPTMLKDVAFDENDETARVYDDLMEQAEYDINDFNLESTTELFNSRSIALNIRRSFNEVYPPEIIASNGWDYTFDLNDD